MSATLDEPTLDTTDRPAAPPREPVRIVLGAITLVAALVAAVAVGWLARGGPATTSTSSVDAGFARDMSTHHTQAVIMAGYTRDHTSDRAVKNLAYDIEYAQTGQIGIMSGWLDSWGLSRSDSGAVMSWMGTGHDMAMGTSAGTDPNTSSLMPGMATPAQVSRLETMTGRALDVYFLQLMLRHHVGGVQMAQYAAAHATHDYVRNLAQKMVDNQTSEIAVMKQMLTARGAQPL